MRSCITQGCAVPGPEGAAEAAGGGLASTPKRTAWLCLRGLGVGCGATTSKMAWEEMPLLQVTRDVQMNG